MPDVRQICVSVRCGWQALYERFWRPESFPLWASGLSDSGLEQAGEVWRAQGPEGPVTIRFTPHNPFGVMDHWVDLGAGREIYMPLRVIGNGDGCLVTLTLFRQPEMTDETFAADAAWVARDLQTLKGLAESGPA
jgi:hypothetical protein